MAEVNVKKKAGLQVVGVPGNTDYGYGALDTGEYLPKLMGRRGSSKFDEMRRSDPQVKSVLRALELPIRKASYYIEPASDKPQDVEIAEIISKNLFEYMSMTWDDTLRHFLLMLPFGFSIMEKVWHVKDNLFQIKKLAPRLPVSVVRWDYEKEKRDLKGPVQQDTDGKEYLLPIEKILVFTNEREGDNWEGTSVLRAAYKPWYMKNKLEVINGIKHDRYGVGIPMADTPPNVERGSEAWNETEKALEELYAHEKSYIISPDGYKISLLSADGGKAGTDPLPSIRYYDEMIARSMLAMFINLGSTQTGSRALGGSFIEVFMDSLQAYADYICEVISRFLLREYCFYNWYVDEFPVLKVGKIKKLDTHTIAVLAKAGVITKDESLEIAVREELDLPEKVEEEENLEEEPEEDPEENMEDGLEEEEDPEEEEGKLIEKVNNKKKSGRKKVSRKVGKSQKGLKLQDLAPEEQIPDLIAIEYRLNESSRGVREELYNIREIQVKDIIQQIVAGRKPNKIRVIKKRDMYDVLMKEYKAQIRAGREEVQEELRYQKNRQGSTFAEGDVPEDYADFIEFGDRKFQIEVEGAGNKLLSQLLILSLTFERQGITGEALMASMLAAWPGAISNQTWDRMANGAVNGGWGAGRTIEGNKHKEEIEYAYYSSVLDKGTCLRCSNRDGHKHAVGDPDYATPNPGCYGGDNCRCINVYVLKEESAKA